MPFGVKIDMVLSGAMKGAISICNICNEYGYSRADKKAYKREISRRLKLIIYLCFIAI